MKLLCRIVCCVPLVASLLWAGCSSTHSAEDLPTLGNIPEFEFEKSTGGTLSRADLEGKVWVAAFIFTRCGGPCPQVSANMQQLQEELKDQAGLRLVTFTVDPEHDTPKVLKDYAEVRHADPERWFFVRGDKEKVYPLIEHGFMLGVQQNKGSEASAGTAVIHSSKLVLVDRKGRIRGYYDGRKVDENGEPVKDVERLRHDALLLLKEAP